mmetsp:Transcript_115189/g.366054  ORF Transcript_115189/g.366054 Transcript_115189/m.366054 type:complete len:311 (-) Transcript_115189:440-1372(-)
MSAIPVGKGCASKVLRSCELGDEELWSDSDSGFKGPQSLAGLSGPRVLNWQESAHHATGPAVAPLGQPSGCCVGSWPSSSAMPYASGRSSSLHPGLSSGLTTCLADSLEWGACPTGVEESQAFGTDLGSAAAAAEVVGSGPSAHISTAAQISRAFFLQMRLQNLGEPSPVELPIICEVATAFAGFDFGGASSQPLHSSNQKQKKIRPVKKQHRQHSKHLRLPSGSQGSLFSDFQDPYALLAAVHPGFIQGSGDAAAGSGNDFFSEGERFDVDLQCMLPPPMTPFIEQLDAQPVAPSSAPFSSPCAWVGLR